MKQLTTIFLISFFALNTYAGIFDWIRPGDGGRPPRYPGGGHSQVTCSATDNGWEEHWGGHGSCRECLKKHGDCVETCSIKNTTCTAEGVDYRGYKMTVQGRSEYRFDAEREAMDRCQYRYENCRITNCSENSEQVSRRSCR